MERKPNASWHECMRVEGKGAECPDCPALIQGRCESLLEKLPRMASHLDGRYRDLPLEDRDQILSETVNKILENLKNDTFRGEAKFTTWIWSIFINKRKDGMRRVGTKGEKLVNLSHLLKNEEGGNEIEESLFRKRLDEQEASKEMREREQEAHRLLSILEKSLPHDSTGCAKLFLDLFYAWENGRRDRDVADDYGYKQNTLTVKKKRCRDVILKLIEVENV